MFPDEGIGPMLQQQLSYLSSCYWKLFPANTAITRSTVLADLGAEAAWTGYSDVISGTWTFGGIVGPGAQAQNTTPPLFFNTSGTTQNFYVVALVDAVAGVIVWATNLGLISFPDGAAYGFNPLVKDQQL